MRVRCTGSAGSLQVRPCKLGAAIHGGTALLHLCIASAPDYVQVAGYECFICDLVVAVSYKHERSKYIDDGTGFVATTEGGYSRALAAMDGGLELTGKYLQRPCSAYLPLMQTLMLLNENLYI
ncbi:hypothetical protein DFQ45_11813 [Thiopseudomonas denitrificans]|uniref:Uncharacterized protein n=1 Tax=Thiopseudomonas denitrificans TaxID=1501432 RepID=A0A4R6TXX3_9GAMM|nr:hypothetical protein DFQ45_11813 [Thiopseudomonas denitrificans]